MQMEPADRSAPRSWFLRIDCKAGDLVRRGESARDKIGIILGMQDANHLRNLDDVDAFYKTGQRLTQVTYKLAKTGWARDAWWRATAG